jgi:MFS family permease
MEATAATRTTAPRLGAAVVPLLALALLIQYVDRGNLGTAAPLMQRELHLSATQIGLLTSAFYWTYVPGQPLAGWLSHRINAYRTLALGLGLWSLATVATGFANGLAMLLGLRLLLGLGESAFFPSSSRLLARHQTVGRLGLANGAITIGLAIGPAVGTYGGGNLMAAAGWRTSFLVFGLVSLLWLAPWWLTTRRIDQAEAHEDETHPSPSFLQVAGRREAWGAALGHMTSTWAFYFVLSWLPLYLVKQRGFSLPEMATVAAAVYAVQAISNPLFGWLADRWIAGGGGVNLVRKTTAVVSHSIVGLALLGASIDDTRVAIACLLLAGAGFGMNSPVIYAIGQTLAGPHAGGKWMGLQNSVGNLSGIVGPIAVGMIVDATHSFGSAFLLSGAIALAGGLCWGVVIPKVAPLNWTTEARP